MLTIMKITLALTLLVLVGASKHPVDNDWEVVFTAVAETGVSVYTSWSTKHTGNCELQKQCIPIGINPAPVPQLLGNIHVLRSPIIDSWQYECIKQVKLELFDKGGKRLAWFLFNGARTDSESWFSLHNLLDSSYVDLKPKCGIQHYNYFSLKGDFKGIRHFFINKRYHGCPGDDGWLMIKDKGGYNCPWERARHFPVFFYSPGRTSSVWQSKGGSASAKVMMVSIRR